MSTKFHIHDIVRIVGETLRPKLNGLNGVIVSFSNHLDADGPYQAVNIDIAGEVVRGISSRNLKRV